MRRLTGHSAADRAPSLRSLARSPLNGNITRRHTRDCPRAQDRLTRERDSQVGDTGAALQAGVQIRSAVPTFLAADVAATARWYAERLGFHTAGTFPTHEPYSYASVQREGAEIMLLSLPGYQKPDLIARRPEGLCDAYIRMRGVRTFYESGRREGFIHMPLKQQPYGDWEFEVRDPNGYVLVFGGAS